MYLRILLQISTSLVQLLFSLFLTILEKESKCSDQHFLETSSSHLQIAANGFFSF